MSTYSHRAKVLGLILSFTSLVGCSSSDDSSQGSPSATGGATNTGGSSTGGSSTGTGGSSTSGGAGGGVTGGTASGGAATGGTATGGTTGSFTDQTSAELVASWDIGWNLGNSLDVPENETAWGNPAVTPALLQAVAEQGFDVVRIPVTWSLHTGNGPGFPIDAAWMTRVEEVVSYAIDAGLYVIINVHHDGADNLAGVEWLTLNDSTGAVTSDNNAQVEQRFTAVWNQIAAHFEPFGEELLFESMNEIHDGYGQPVPAYYDIINDLNQTFVDVVRASGPNNAQRHLVVPGYNTNIDYTIAGFEAPQDPTPNRLILSAHYYDPWPFAGEGSTHTWGSASANADDFGQEDSVTSQFDRLESKFIDAGLPMILGEYGAINQAGYENYRRYYMEYVTKAAVDHGIVPIYWDNGGTGTGMDNFGLINRSTNAVAFPEILEAMMRAATSTYTLADVAKP